MTVPRPRRGIVGEQLVELRLMAERHGPCGRTAEGQHAAPVYGDVPLVGIDVVNNVDRMRSGIWIHDGGRLQSLRPSHARSVLLSYEAKEEL